MRYILIDTANTFFRARHIASKNSDPWEKVGMAIHLTLSSVQQVVRKYGSDEPTHVVFALEGRSWRKDFYKPYKANRAVKTAALTEAEAEEDKLFWETYDKFTEYLREKTNVSVLRCAEAEADDIIARFIHLHPHDHHYIVSSDTDYVQLLSENVKQFNGMANQLITIEGIFDDKGKIVKDKKTGEAKAIPDPAWLQLEQHDATTLGRSQR